MTQTVVPLSLGLSGAFSVRTCDGPLDGLSRRGQALVAYLTQQPGMRAERARLADLLWSDRSEEQGRASLRQELSVLRRVLPEGVLDANRQHVWLDQTRVMLEHGTGVFMDGFDLGSEGFEDWLRGMRGGRTEEATFLSRPAVLLFAFEALSPGDQDAMIALGLADDLRTTLSYWRWFPVIGPEAIGWKTAREVDLREAARQVDAAYAVTGTLRCAGNRVKIAVSLTEVETGRSRWSQTFDGSLDDIFAFQEEVSYAIVAQLEPEIAHAEASRIARVRPASVGPWQLLAQAGELERIRGEGYGTPESNKAQMQLMQEALKIDPAFAPALACIARVHFRFALLSWAEDRAAAYETSLDYSSRALAADQSNWEAHAYFGLARLFGHHDFSAGEFHTREAVRLNPSAAVARHGLGCALEWLGEPEEALEHLELIFRLNPGHPGRAAVSGQVATCEMFLDRRDRALGAARKLLALAGDYPRGLQRCVFVFGYFDALDLAGQALARLRQLQPDFGEAYVRETYPYARARDLDAVLQGFHRAGAFGP